MSVWRKLVTAIKGGATEAAQSVADSQAIRILEQEIREAKDELRKSDHARTQILAKCKLSQQKVDSLQASVEQYETHARKAIDTDRQLALDCAQKVGDLRAEQDVEKARKFALEQFCKELLPVIDNLERALEAAPADEPVVKPIAEGVELTLKSFADAFARFKIEAVNPLGEPFDPQLHQAMSMVENADIEPNTVTLVMQKGYTLHGRLVRPAMVMVSKAVANS